MRKKFLFEENENPERTKNNKIKLINIHYPVTFVHDKGLRQAVEKIQQLKNTQCKIRLKPEKTNFKS